MPSVPTPACQVIRLDDYREHHDQDDELDEAVTALEDSVARCEQLVDDIHAQLDYLTVLVGLFIDSLGDDDDWPGGDGDDPEPEPPVHSGMLALAA